MRNIFVPPQHNNSHSRLVMSTVVDLSKSFLKSSAFRTSVVTLLSVAKMASTTDARLLRQTKFPPEFNQKVDMKKVNIEVMKK